MNPLPAKATVEIRPEPAVTAEILVEDACLWVTLCLPHLPLANLRVDVTAQAIHLHSKEPTALHLVVPLPTHVEPGRYVLRAAHGVLDLRLERACL